MKKLLVGALLLFCFALPAWSANFVEIVRNDENLIYLDLDSIEMRTQAHNRYLVVWTKWISRGEEAKKDAKIYKQPVDYIMELFACNMEQRQIQRLSSLYYNKKGQIIDKYLNEFLVSRYIDIPPQTYADWIYEIVERAYEVKSTL